MYKQAGKIEKSSLSQITDSALSDRMKYLVADVVKMFNLGDPVAGNFFKAEYDDYVPEFYKKIAERYNKKE